MEARRIIFIGYSLPHADFEFRQLLSRMVHPMSEIRVVLYKQGDDDAKFVEEVKRYEQFFAGRKVEFEENGVVEFVAHYLGNERDRR